MFIGITIFALKYADVINIVADETKHIQLLEACIPKEGALRILYITVLAE